MRLQIGNDKKNMSYEDFISSLKLEHPPEGLHPLLLSLWYDGKGDWEKSHNIAQDIDSKDASWIHAYLHRKEGDDWNADYWYRRAGAKRPDCSLEEEWRKLILHLLI